MRTWDNGGLFPQVRSNDHLKLRVQRLERQMRIKGRATAADQQLRRRLQAARKRVAENLENEARQKGEEAA
jgi:hypothetical protein